MSRCIMVLTPGRTGSSAIARMLHTLGVQMGHPDTLVDIEEDYAPHGLFEDDIFWNINYELWADDDPNLDHIVSCYSLLFYSRRKLEIWGLKDPQAIHCFDVFEPLLRDYRVIFSMRSRDAIINSYLDAFGGGDYLKDLNKTGMPEERFVEEMIDERLALIDGLREDAKFKYITVPYEDLLEHPIGWTALIVAFAFEDTGVYPHPRFFEIAANTIDPSLRRF